VLSTFVCDAYEMAHDDTLDVIDAKLTSGLLALGATRRSVRTSDSCLATCAGLPRAVSSSTWSRSS
jgi:hypothetical protein